MTAEETDLENAIKKYHKQLLANGDMNGGTHASWELGMNGFPTWSSAFSMASRARQYLYPLEGQDFEQWKEKFENLHQAFWLEGNPMAL
jgi:hypothetical protein